jgi:hypothetical protein
VSVLRVSFVFSHQLREAFFGTFAGRDVRCTDRDSVLQPHRLHAYPFEENTLVLDLQFRDVRKAGFSSTWIPSE